MPDYDKNIRRRKDKAILAYCLNIIEDFQPDIIHVFGSEWCFGLVEKYTNIPVVIHMQGSLPPYANAAFPPGYNFFTQWRNSHFSPIVLLKNGWCGIKTTTIRQRAK